MADIAAHAFDIACWRLDRSWVEAEFVSPSIEIMTCVEKKKSHIFLDQVSIHQSDEAIMARFRMKNLKSVQAKAKWV